MPASSRETLKIKKETLKMFFDDVPATPPPATDAPADGAGDGMVETDEEEKADESGAAM